MSQDDKAEVKPKKKKKKKQEDKEVQDVNENDNTVHEMTKEDSIVHEMAKKNEVLHDKHDDGNEMDNDELKEDESGLPEKETSANEVSYYSSEMLT